MIHPGIGVSSRYDAEWIAGAGKPEAKTSRVLAEKQR
jgi:hypothetical protein